MVGMQLFIGSLIGWVRKNGVSIIAFIILSLLYAVLRVIALRDMPIFTDEAIYIRWAQMGYYDAAQRLTSLSDGKQPLYIWLVTFAMSLVSNPLLAGRGVSILAGYLTAVGLYLLAHVLFKHKWVSILAVCLYVLLPYSLVYNRMALYESTTGMFFVWSLYLSVVLTQSLRLHDPFILALVLGGGVLTKTTGFLSVYLLPVLVLLLPKPNTNFVSRLIRWVGYVALATALGYLYYSILMLSPGFSQIGEKNSIFLYHMRELVPYGAFDAWLPNMSRVVSWIAQYMSVPAFAIGIVSCMFFQKQWRQKAVLLLWFIIPFIGYGLFGRQLNPRYIYPIMLPLLPLFASTLVHAYEQVKLKMIVCVSLAVVIVSMLYVDGRIIVSFATSPIPQEDLSQYINGIPAGGGIRESTKYLLAKAQEGPLYIATEGVYGSLPTTVVELYFSHHPAVVKKGFEVTERVPKYMIQQTYETPVYVIFNSTQNPPNWPMKEVGKYKKGISKTYLRMYQLERIPLDRCGEYVLADQKTVVQECQ